MLSTSKPRLSVIVPVLNERGSIQAILERVAARPEVLEILVVDDGSTDGTRELLRETAIPKVRVIEHPRNRGKGAAVRTGLENATAEFVVVQDADLEYDPNDYPQLLEPLLKGTADVVYGARFSDGKPPGMKWLYYLANRFLTALSNIRTGWKLSDMETCYKMMRRDLAQKLTLTEDRFGFEPEITLALAKAGARITELPIAYEARTREQGKKIGWKDGWESLKVLLRARRKQVGP